jgi:ubiquinone/menaquinone biosynthesis C-methylase UbiE
MRSKEMVSTDYDDAAQSYDNVRFGSPGGKYADQVEKDLLSRVVKGKTALEIGTATGRFAITLVRMGYEYTGVDLSLAMLRVTSQRTSFAEERTDLLQMDVEQMAFRRHFDNVICIRTFHFLPNPSLALQNMRDALNRRGRCLVTFETDNPLRRFALMLHMGRSRQRYYKRQEVEGLFHLYELRVTAAGPVLRIPVTLYRRCPAKLLVVLRVLEHLWPWPTHEYVLGETS